MPGADSAFARECALLRIQTGYNHFWTVLKKTFRTGPRAKQLRSFLMDPNELEVDRQASGLRWKKSNSRRNRYAYSKAMMAIGRE